LPWTEKYRPSIIEDIRSHDNIMMTLNKFIETDSLPHLLFYGPSGTGKTTTIKCCAKKIYGAYDSYMTMLMNASNDRGIGTVRTIIKNFVSSDSNTFLPQEFKKSYKMIILDEIDSMTSDAQRMLRQTIEKNTTTTRFCLLCNDIDKINIALRSRCMTFRFAPIERDCIYLQLLYISESENMNITKGALHTISEISDGDMRCAINILQRANISYTNKIKRDEVYLITSHISDKIVKQIYRILCGLVKKPDELNTTINRLIKIAINNNITLTTLVDRIGICVFGDNTINAQRKLVLIDNLANIEIQDTIISNIHHSIITIASLFLLPIN
jgi:replication factor C subunit 3/5